MLLWAHQCRRLPWLPLSGTANPLKMSRSVSPAGCRSGDEAARVGWDTWPGRKAVSKPAAGAGPPPGHGSPASPEIPARSNALRAAASTPWGSRELTRRKQASCNPWSSLLPWKCPQSRHNTPAPARPAGNKLFAEREWRWWGPGPALCWLCCCRTP